MTAILVLQHHPDEGLATLATLLAARGHAVDLRKLYQGDSLPGSMIAHAALILMGGPMSVYDEAEYPWLAREKSLIRAAARDGCPILGHCLGAQLITVALGGKVESNPSGLELGWWPVSLTAAGQIYWPEMRREFPLFHWHGEHCVTLPAGADVLARNDATPVQAFAIGSQILALQAHPEVTAEQVRQWSSDNAADLTAGGEYVQTVPTMLHALDQACAQLAVTATALYGPWLKQIERQDG